MLKFFIRWAINSIALLLVVHMTSRVSVDSWTVLIAAALVLGLLNAFLKPLIVIITLPFNIMSLGLFTLVINGFLFYLASKLTQGFHVAGFWSAMWAALLFSIVSFFLNMFTGGGNVRAGTGGGRRQDFRSNSIDAEVVEEKKRIS